jgi:hypothetical protein
VIALGELERIAEEVVVNCFIVLTQHSLEGLCTTCRPIRSVWKYTYECNNWLPEYYRPVYSKTMFRKRAFASVLRKNASYVRPYRWVSPCLRNVFLYIKNRMDTSKKSITVLIQYRQELLNHIYQPLNGYTSPWQSNSLWTKETELYSVTK